MARPMSPKSSRNQGQTPIGEILVVPGIVRAACFEAKRRSDPNELQSYFRAAYVQSSKQQAEEEELKRGRRHLLVLCLFAFWTQFNPSEPFLVDYLVDIKGFSGPMVYQHIFDLFIYARMPCVVLVGIISWQGSGRNILIGGAACGLATALMTRFSTQLVVQQFAQLTVAMAFSSRIVCPAMALAIASPEQSQQSVHALKAIMLLSNFASAALGEVLRDFCGMPLTFLFDISSCGQAISLVCAIMLPEPNKQEEESSSEEGTPSEEDVGPEGMHCREGQWMWQKLLTDLRISLTLPTVMWWTAWALLMNPVHGIVMTYWQGLVRSKHILSDHNGAMLSCMYLFAGVFTLVSGSSPRARGQTCKFVIGSMLAAGLLLVQVVRETHQLPIYFWLLLFQCLFEVTTAIGTYQTGTEVSQSRGNCAPGVTRVTSGGGFRQPKSIGRLTMLFSATSIVAGVNENIMLFLINGWSSISLRFFSLGMCLLSCSFILAIARGVKFGLPQPEVKATGADDVSSSPLLEGSRS